MSGFHPGTARVALTVISAFNQFLATSVNLDSDQTARARRSRKWLLDQVHQFPESDTHFPGLLPERAVAFGSFSRRTKKRPLDDIDVMVCLHAQGCEYSELGDQIAIYVPDEALNLKNLCSENSNRLNSRRVINRFIASLRAIDQYKKAEISRNGEAATIELSSYDWNFDLVPCFHTSPEYSGRTYYLIPDGQGEWKKTDPSKDQDRVSTLNQRHDGNLLAVIRTIKFWNARPTMPSMGSYLLENMVLDYYETLFIHKASSFVDMEIPRVLRHIRDSVYGPVADPNRQKAHSLGIKK